jgi:hypothetical protein
LKCLLTLIEKGVFGNGWKADGATKMCFDHQGATFWAQTKATTASKFGLGKRHKVKVARPTKLNFLPVVFFINCFSFFTFRGYFFHVPSASGFVFRNLS